VVGLWIHLTPDVPPPETRGQRSNRLIDLRKIRSKCCFVSNREPHEPATILKPCCDINRKILGKRFALDEIVPKIQDSVR
jgi:hypothetical protein